MHSFDPKQSRILVVDDNPTNILLLKRVFQHAGYSFVRGVQEPTEVAEMVSEWNPDLVILDLHMPGMTGFEVLEQLRANQAEDEFLPILIFTADVTSDAKRKALELGASDFLTKPGDATEILLRSGNFLKMRFLYGALAEHNHLLEAKVSERTHELEAAQLEIVDRLAMASEYRDDDTGHHARRVGEMAGQIARKLGLPEAECEIIALAGALHDIGKIGIPDAILLKNGRLDPEEFDLMKTHTLIGAKVCAGSRSPILQVAETIAISHHERWDGTGYPNRLKGEDIPLVGRICAVADVFDALCSERPYKDAMSRQDAIAEIQRSAGTHFDPKVVQAFIALQSAEEDELAAAA